MMGEIMLSHWWPRHRNLSVWPSLPCARHLTYKCHLTVGVAMVQDHEAIGIHEGQAELLQVYMAKDTPGAICKQFTILDGGSTKEVAMTLATQTKHDSANKHDDSVFTCLPNHESGNGIPPFKFAVLPTGDSLHNNSVATGSKDGVAVLVGMAISNAIVFSSFVNVIPLLQSPPSFHPAFISLVRLNKLNRVSLT